ncbi:MAG TPA: transcriptional activator NhaR [Methylothermaceae bacterium]|nr:transcriptional activator NhaR [Methylothermaceae bacterium]
MSRINYKHLYYFWVTAQEGGLTRAAERLHLTPQTICAQIQSLEDHLKVKLLRREGRGLVLTDTGRTVFRYADEIFSLGEEMAEVIQRQIAVQPQRFSVGITEYLPKLVAHRLLQPVLTLADSIRLHCHEDHMENLVAGLAAHRIDLILSDRPLAADSPVKAYSHFLGECGMSFLACPELAGRYRDQFPGSLNGAPMLMAGGDAVMRSRLWSWFEQLGALPRVVAEFDDSALMKVFGQAGAGIFCVPSIIEAEVVRQHQVEVVGRTCDVLEHFYFISLERRLRHPAVTAIHQTAKELLFSQAI